MTTKGENHSIAIDFIIPRPRFWLHVDADADND